MGFRLRSASILITLVLFVIGGGGAAFGQADGSGSDSIYSRQRTLVAAPPRQPVAPQAPFQLTPQQQKAVDQILKFWELYSGRVTRYRCKFTRYEYDSNFGPRDPNMAKTRSDGEIRYQAPDKGLFRVDTLLHYTPQQSGPPKFLARAGERGEHWICDGKAIFDYDYINKRLKVQELPPDMQGAAIADGPLPFLFGAKAEKIKQRYWVRIVAPPPESQGKEHWLQAFPKTRQDAANFKMVEVILDAKLFLPSAIQVYDRSYDGRSNFSRTVYVFADRKVNERFTAESLNMFNKAFYKPSVPLGWKKVVQKFAVGGTANRAVAPPERPDRQASGRPLYGPHRGANSDSRVPR
jgi:TIGR03009 family protein